MLGSDAASRETGSLTVRFWGTRGSFPAPGPKTVRYGGNTSCVEIRLGTRLFMIDAGSGLIKAGEDLLAEAPERIDLLLSHLHHDHVLGLPFFKPALSGRTIIRTFCGNLGGQSAAGPLAAMFAPPLFPVTLDQLPSRFEHVGFKAGETLDFEGGIRIATCPLFHPGGATGYRFDHNGRRVCYISDVEHGEPWPASGLVRFCRGADLIIFDCMYTSKQYGACKGWGHSTWFAGLALCQAAQAKAMAAYHHNPVHTDADLDLIQAEMAVRAPGSFVAVEGQTVSFAPVRQLMPAETP